MSLTPTAEQQDILDAAASGGTVAISAGAGSGKTSTLRLLAEARPYTRMLYVAYNKAIQVAAAASFPPNVTAKTAHSLAFQRFGAPMVDRLNGPRQPGHVVASILGITQPVASTAKGADGEPVLYEPKQLGAWVMGMVSRFCRTAHPTITKRHFSAPDGMPEADEIMLSKVLVPLARRAWDDLTAGSKGQLKPTHDVYLKQWQLSKPSLSGWDVILYDEAQDADPAIADVVEHQDHAQLIAVGDSAQAIYGWRGAGDFLSRVDADHRLRLTQSWRFGQNVADEANVWLGVVGTDMQIIGNPTKSSTVTPLSHPDATLCRSNAGTIVALVQAHAAGTPVHLVGGGKEMLALARAAERMMDGLPSNHPELAAFSTWRQVVDFAKNDPAGSDLAVSVRIIEKYTPGGVVDAIERAVPEARAQLVVSTAHKAKGLEWNRVRIERDFPIPTDNRTGDPLPVPAAEAMLAYVAVTRAMDTLDNAGLSWIHQHLASLDEAAANSVTPATSVHRPPAIDAEPLVGVAPSEAAGPEL